MLSENVDYEKFLQALMNILSAKNHVDLAEIGNTANFPKGRPFICGAKNMEQGEFLPLIVSSFSFLCCFCIIYVLTYRWWGKAGQRSNREAWTCGMDPIKVHPLASVFDSKRLVVFEL